jgi:Tfp pilus assembly protein PilO
MNGIDLVGMIVFMGSLTGMAAIVARAVLRYQDQRLRGRRDTQDPGLRAELEDLRAQLAEQQDLRQRLTELEERVDFAERLLAQAKRDRLSAGGESA